MELFDAFLVMDGGNEHPAGVDAHHGSRREIHDGNARFSNQFFRFVIFVNAGKDNSILSSSVIQYEFRIFGLLGPLRRI